MADYSEANADGKRSIVDSQLREKEIIDSSSGLMSLKKSETSCSKKIDIIASNLSRSDSGFLDSESDSQKIDPEIKNTDTAVKNLSDAFLAKKPVEDLNKKLKEQIKNSENLKCVISELTESTRKSSKYSEKDGKVGTKKAETAVEIDQAYKRINDGIEDHDKTIYEGKLNKLQTKIISEKLGLDNKKAEDLTKDKKDVDIKSQKIVGKQKEVDFNKKSEQSHKLSKLLEKVDETNDSNISPDSLVKETFEKDITVSLNNETDCQLNDVKEDKSQSKKNKDFGNKEDKISGTKRDLSNSENVETISKNVIEIRESERSKNKLDSRTESKKRVDSGKNKEKNSGNKKISETDKLECIEDEHNEESKIDTSDKRTKDVLDGGETEVDKSKKLVPGEKIRERNIEKHKDETSPVKNMKGKKSQNETEVIEDSDERKKATDSEKIEENKASDGIEKDKNEKVCKFKKDISPKKNERINKTEVKKETEDILEASTKDGRKSEGNDKVELSKKDKEIDKNNIVENEKKDNAEVIVKECRTKDKAENKINEVEPKNTVENAKKKNVNKEKKDKEVEKKSKMDEKKSKTDDYSEPVSVTSQEEIVSQIDKTIENSEINKGDDKEKNYIGNVRGRKSSERIRGRETLKGKNTKEPKKSPNKKEETPKSMERLGVELRPRRKPEIKTPEIKPPPPPKQSRQRNTENRNLVPEEKKITPKGIDTEKSKSQGTAKKVSTTSDNKNDGTSDLDTEMKGYAADAMNELLGLYGYDKVDETEKNSLNLSNSLLKTTPATTAVPTKKQLVQQPAPLPPATTTTSNSTSTTTTSSSTPSSTGSSSNADKSIQKQHPCIVCRQIKKCKYNIVRNGDVRYLCEDECFQKFRAKPTDYLQVIDSGPKKCHVCQKDISMPGGMLPLPGDPTKPVCSEQCSKNYQMQQGPQKVCAQCKFAIQSGKKFLSWETMEFCCEECLGKYQTGLGIHCNFCHVEIQRTSLGKHCIKVGSEIKQFCTGNCHDEFRKGLKVCNYCQKDLSNNPEGFLAPVGDKGEFKDFCSQACMEKYDSKLKDRNNWNSGSKQTCSVCKKTGPIKNEVSYEGTKYFLCSDPCVSSFSFSNNLTVGTCDNCGVFCYNDKSQPFFIQFEGKTKRFCSNMCVSAFRLAHSKIVSCTWCKSKKFNFDMIERVDANNKYQHFCSLNCLSLYRVSLNATSSRSVPCDCCKQVVPAQYHLTMSDASVRNFCSYSCVVQFQNQFTGVTPIITRIQSQQQNSITTITAQGQSSQSSPTPIISSVVSLAPMNQQQTTQPQTTPTGKRQVQQNKTTPAYTPKQNTVSTVQRRVTTTTTTNNNTRSSVPSPLPTNTTSRVKAIQPLQSATTHVSTTTPSPTIQQQVIVQHPPPKQLKNKALLCKPFMQTKATSCRPHTSCKITQTEDYMGKPILIPVPVPVYVPIPMHMYTVPIPFPMAIPIPIPVPCFIPTTKNSADSILRHIKEIQDKIPTDPFEAELLMMAEMVASADTHTAESKDSSEAGETEPPADHTGADFQMDSQDPLHATNVLGDDMLQMALRMASEMTGPAVDLETALAPDANSQAQMNDEKIKSSMGNYLLAKSDFGVLDESRDIVSPRDLRARQRSQKRTSSGRGGRRGKRARIEEPIRINSSPVLLTADANMCLKYTYGVNAWKHWVLQKNAALEKASQRSGKLKLFKTDLLQLTADELNYSLCLFVKEVRKPNGEEYAPDSIYYLCLGIQQYLFENCRIDNIFTDIYYEKFTECLNEIVQRYEVRFNEAGILVCRIEEEILWESKQLGAHSPHVLLNSLLYFNTKYFMLKTSEDHQRLSFSHVLKQWRKSTGGSKNNSGRTMYLRYCPPINEIKKGKREELAVFEQQENIDNPLRCPVKLYEFYLSKCPESIKNRNDVFYLVPERSCVPDSPVWYSTQPLGKEALSKMLHRIQMVREVNEAHMQMA